MKRQKYQPIVSYTASWSVLGVVPLHGTFFVIVLNIKQCCSLCEETECGWWVSQWGVKLLCSLLVRSRYFCMICQMAAGWTGWDCGWVSLLEAPLQCCSRQSERCPGQGVDVVVDGSHTELYLETRFTSPLWPRVQTGLFWSYVTQVSSHT